MSRLPGGQVNFCFPIIVTRLSALTGTGGGGAAGHVQPRPRVRLHAEHVHVVEVLVIAETHTEGFRWTCVQHYDIWQLAFGKRLPFQLTILRGKVQNYDNW